MKNCEMSFIKYGIVYLYLLFIYENLIVLNQL